MAWTLEPGPVRVAKHDFGYLRRGQPGSLAQLVWRENSDRMRHDGVWVVRHAPHGSQLIQAWFESFGGDADAWNP
jgi:hypothetical protein